jgi:hypothetical protein
MTEHADTLWGQVLEVMQTKVSKPSYETWFRNTEGVKVNGNTIVVKTPHVIGHYALVIFCPSATWSIAHENAVTSVFVKASNFWREVGDLLSCRRLLQNTDISHSLRQYPLFRLVRTVMESTTVPQLTVLL